MKSLAEPTNQLQNRYLGTSKLGEIESLSFRPVDRQPLVQDIPRILLWLVTGLKKTYENELGYKGKSKSEG